MKKLCDENNNEQKYGPGHMKYGLRFYYNKGKHGLCGELFKLKSHFLKIKT